MGISWADTSFQHNSELPTCKSKWRGLINKNLHHYDYHKDGKYKVNGNFGYHHTYLKRIDRRNCKKEWTFLVFMAADNDLTPYALWDIYEMESGYNKEKRYNGSTLKMDLLVELDTFKNKDEIRRYHIFQTGKPYNSHLNIDFWNQRTWRSVRSPVVQNDLREINLSHPITQAQRLQEYIEWGMEEYPSEKLAVIIWGHGQGNLVATDESQNMGINIFELKDVLQHVKAKRNGRTIDLLINDACLMQTLEVVTELSDQTRYIIGPETRQSFLGLPYRRIFHEINNGTWNTDAGGQNWRFQEKDEAYKLALMIPELVKSSFNPNGPMKGLQSYGDKENYKTMIVSSIATDPYREEFLTSLTQFSETFFQFIQENKDHQFELLMLISQSYGFFGEAKEFGLFLGAIEGYLRNELNVSYSVFAQSSGEVLLKQIEMVLNYLDKSIVSKVYGSRYSKEIFSDYAQLINYFKGISFVGPSSPESYESSKESLFRYKLYNQATDGFWRKWFESLYTPPD